jgi:hypothetical protein
MVALQKAALCMGVWCTQGYFQSRNCMRELVSTTKMEKRIIALMEPDMQRGGLSVADVQEQLSSAEASHYATWGFDEGTPTAAKLFEVLLVDRIEWNRIGVRTQLPSTCGPMIGWLVLRIRDSTHAWQHFQDVTMRLIAERALDTTVATYVDREITSQALTPLEPLSGTFHIYCSKHNPGAKELMFEAAIALDLSLAEFKETAAVGSLAGGAGVEMVAPTCAPSATTPDEGSVRRQRSARRASRPRRGSNDGLSKLSMTTDIEQLADCEVSSAGSERM